MTIFNDTNKGRIDKMVDTCALIEKSILSNRAPAEDVWKLFQPLVSRMEGILTGEPPAPASETSEASESPLQSVETTETKHIYAAEPPAKAPMWAHVRDMAEQAPLQELHLAMIIYMNRLEDLHKA